MTVAAAENKHHAARVFAASREVSLSAEFFFDNPPRFSKAIRIPRADNHKVGSESARLPCKQEIGPTAKIENRK
jgi:hypothetical protein